MLMLRQSSGKKKKVAGKWKPRDWYNNKLRHIELTLACKRFIVPFVDVEKGINCWKHKIMSKSGPNDSFEKPTGRNSFTCCCLLSFSSPPIYMSVRMHWAYGIWNKFCFMHAQHTYIYISFGGDAKLVSFSLFCSNRKKGNQTNKARKSFVFGSFCLTWLSLVSVLVWLYSVHAAVLQM